MNKKLITLRDLRINEKGNIVSLLVSGMKRRRFLDLGFIKGTTVQVIHQSSAGGLVAYFVRGTVIALREEDTQKIYVRRS